MLTKRNILLLILCVLSVAMAIVALMWAKKTNADIDAQLSTFSEATNSGSAQEAPAAEFLMSDFAPLLSEESIAAMYEGEEDFGFSSEQGEE